MRAQLEGAQAELRKVLWDYVPSRSPTSSRLLAAASRALPSLVSGADAVVPGIDGPDDIDSDDDDVTDSSEDGTDTVESDDSCPDLLEEAV